MMVVTEQRYDLKDVIFFSLPFLMSFRTFKFVFTHCFLKANHHGC